MPLPSPRLDDLSFQQILDTLRRRIPHYCPEWTDHNLSDPGITMLELFAHLGEMLSYRVNRVPELVYVKFLEMLSIELEPPAAATTEVFFRLTAPLTQPLSIARWGAEVTPRRTSPEERLSFTLCESLNLQPPSLSMLSPGNWMEARLEGVTETLSGASATLKAFDAFPPGLRPQQGLFIGVSEELSRHCIRLHLKVVALRAAGVGNNPPLDWVAWSDDGVTLCEVEEDTTKGLQEDGRITLYLPPLQRRTLGGVSAFWFGCRIRDQVGEERYDASPQLTQISIEVLGGASRVMHCSVVVEERLGESDGSPGQTFQLSQTPVLPCDSDEFLMVELPDGRMERWNPVAGFAGCGPDDPCYHLDPHSGVVTFAPHIPTPTGELLRFGRIPPRGSRLSFTRYRFGGGASGNVSADQLVVLKPPVPGIATVRNRLGATGGRNAETLEHAKMRTAALLSHRDRAVCPADYEHLIQSHFERLMRTDPGLTHGLSGLKALCVGVGRLELEGRDPSADGTRRLARVRVLARQSGSEALPVGIGIDGAGPHPVALRSALKAELERLSPIGVVVDVANPDLIRVSIAGSLIFVDGISEDQKARLLESSEQSVRQFLNPFVGWHNGHGWPFGRRLLRTELEGLISSQPGIDYVELRLVTAPQEGIRALDEQRIDVSPWALFELEQVHLTPGLDPRRTAA